MAQRSLGWVDGYLNDWTMYIATCFSARICLYQGMKSQAQTALNPTNLNAFGIHTD